MHNLIAHLLNCSYSTPRKPGERPLMEPPKQDWAAALPLLLLLVVVLLAAVALLVSLEAAVSRLLALHAIAAVWAALGCGCVLQLMLVKVLATTWHGTPPTVKRVIALLPGKLDRGKPLPAIVTVVPPAVEPIAGLTDSTTG